jgi:hypothetical protein
MLSGYDDWLWKQCDEHMERMYQDDEFECTQEDDCECEECQQAYIDYVEMQAECEMENRKLERGYTGC